MGNISESEYEIMKIIWNNGVMTSNDIIEKLKGKKKWSKNTVRTLLNRLTNKKAIRIVAQEGKNYRYQAVISEIEYESQESKSFLEKMYQGSIQNMVLQFVKENKLTKEELIELIDLIEKEE